MADAEGPGNHKHRVCASRSTLADLGDTRGFREEGVPSQVYGLELTKEGYYRRAPIVLPTTRKEVEWTVHIELLPQYMDIEYIPPATALKDGVLQEGEQRVVRIVNVGAMHLSYQTSDPLNMVGLVHHYVLLAQTTPAILNAITMFSKDSEILKKPPKGSAIYIELVLDEAPSGFVEVLPGLSISWKKGKKALVALVITKPENKYVVASTSADVTVKEPTKISLTMIHCSPHYAFRRLLFSVFPESAAYLENLASDLDRHEKILRTLHL
jgi:hypothetical protein